MEEITFSHYTIDFAKIAVEYCMIIEKMKETDKITFVSTMIKVLALLYLKISILPVIKTKSKLYDKQNRIDKNFQLKIEKNIENLLGKDNFYLTPVHSDISVRNYPIIVKISTDLVSIYKYLGNFIHLFKDGNKKNMNNALFICVNSFEKYWGHSVVSSLQALHIIKYKQDME